MSLKLTFINVGYGESILLQCVETGFTMLVDAGGAEPSEYADASSGRIRTHEYLRGIGLKHIDLMVSTHIHEDHLCGMLPVAAMLPPKALWHTLPADFADGMRFVDPALAENTSQDKFIRAMNDYQTFCRDLKAAGCRMETVLAGHAATLCPGLDCAVLAPSAQRMAGLQAKIEAAYRLPDGPELLAALSVIDAAMNNYSIILRLDYQGTRILLPGDTNRAGYGDIDPAALRADVFKVGHHGQVDGANQALIDAVRPRFAVCCASSDRRYNSAHPDLMRALRDSGAQLCFSDCPPVKGVELHPHHALTFTIGDGEIKTEYL